MLFKTKLWISVGDGARDIAPVDYDLWVEVNINEADPADSEVIRVEGTADLVDAARLAGIYPGSSTEGTGLAEEILSELRIREADYQEAMVGL